jgi:hypothetical protein
MMSNEEFDRRMEFFLNQQARFDADMRQMKEFQKRTEKKLDRFFEGLAGTKELATRTAEELAELVSLTTEGFKITFENSKNTDAKINALIASQMRTDEIVRNIGKKLERHLNEDHNST